MRSIIVLTTLFLLQFSIFAQSNERMSSSEIQHSLEKLGVIGNVMYFAAHPDDENTRLIAWLANEGMFRTSYLSLTRGDGGQNLIGNEKGPYLGMLRTQELLAARSIDGGEQYFTRAIDFGYSKSADETFDMWDKDQLVADAVYNIRKFKPDVIITRFPPDSRAGHGHHTASAIIAQEAFKAASNPKKYPESAELFGTWKPRRLFFNTHAWFDKEIEQKADRLLEINVGAYNPLLGKTYTEIAAEARSQHRCQAFGTPKEREYKIEYLELVDGDPLVDQEIFDGISTNWNRTPDGDGIQELINNIVADFDHSKPSESLQGLYQLYSMVSRQDDHPWKEQKLEEITNLIVACAGFWAEFIAEEALIVVDQPYPVRLELTSATPLTLKEVRVGWKVYAEERQLDDHLLVFRDTLDAPSEISNPYWLSDAPENNFFAISKAAWLGLAENEAPLEMTIEIQTEFMPITIKRPIEYKWTDRARGELYRDITFIRPATSHIERPVYLLTSDTSCQVPVRITAHKDMDSLVVIPTLEKPWVCDTNQVVLYDLKAGLQYDLSFGVRSTKDKAVGSLSITLDDGEKEWNSDLMTIDYTHIHPQVLMPESKTRLVRTNIKIDGEHIAYIMGSGDEIPEMLRLMGYSVDVVNPNELSAEVLASYDAVMTGIRAYNTVDELPGLYPALMSYVEAGGVLVTLYNTSYSLKTDQLGPYPLKIGRGRVTEEDAKAIMLVRDHPALNYPNQIEQDDFDDWVQERGLYFIEEWDEHYTPIIGWADEGSDRLDGALLTTPYGNGRYVYTSISFFRELPAGVPGAFKLMANLLANPTEVQDGE